MVYIVFNNTMNVFERTYMEKTKQNQIISVAEQMQQLDEKEFTMITFLIDGFLLKSKLDSIESEKDPGSK